MATTDDGVQLVAVMGEVVDEKQVIEHEDTGNLLSIQSQVQCD